jgi:hypothetical protein
MNTNLTKVVSSQIAAVGHANNILTVQFNNGATYEYANVDDGLYAKLMEAESIGSYFSREIKAKQTVFPFTKVA